MGDMTEMVRVGEHRSRLLRCRLFGCKPLAAWAIVRVRLSCDTVSRHQKVKLCRRCLQVTTSIDVKAAEGTTIDSVQVEMQEVVDGLGAWGTGECHPIPRRSQ